MVAFVDCKLLDETLDVNILDDVMLVNCPFVNNPFDIVDDVA